MLYLIDSICKNCSSSSAREFYTKIFKGKIASLFSEFYKECGRSKKKDDLRRDLRCLRGGWLGIFPDDVLKAMRDTVWKNDGDDIDNMYDEEQLVRLIQYYRDRGVGEDKYLQYLNNYNNRRMNAFHEESAIEGKIPKKKARTVEPNVALQEINEIQVETKLRDFMMSNLYAPVRSLPQPVPQNNPFYPSQTITHAPQTSIRSPYMVYSGQHHPQQQQQQLPPSNIQYQMNNDHIPQMSNSFQSSSVSSTQKNALVRGPSGPARPLINPNNPTGNIAPGLRENVGMRFNPNENRTNDSSFRTPNNNNIINQQHSKVGGVRRGSLMSQNQRDFLARARRVVNELEMLPDHERLSQYPFFMIYYYYKRMHPSSSLMKQEQIEVSNLQTM